MKKKLLPYILILIAFFLVNCQDEGTLNIPDNMINGAYPVMLPSSDTVFYYNDLENLSTKFSIDIKGEAQEIRVIGTYNDSISQQMFTFSSWPVDVDINMPQLLTAFSGKLNSISDIKLNDVFKFSVDIVLPDGTVLKGITYNNNPGYGPGIRAETGNKYELKYKVSCISELEGTYQVLSSGTSTDPAALPNPLTDLVSTIEIIKIEGNTYQISDAFCGVYKKWYAKYGYIMDTPGEITDNCGAFEGTWHDNFGENVTYSGSVDSEAGTINITWENESGDTMISTLKKL